MSCLIPLEVPSVTVWWSAGTRGRSEAGQAGGGGGSILPGDRCHGQPASVATCVEARQSLDQSMPGIGTPSAESLLLLVVGS